MEVTVSDWFASLLKRNLPWKDRICSPGEQILSPLEKTAFQKAIDLKESKQEVTKAVSLVKWRITYQVLTVPLTLFLLFENIM